jgi:hypothetical protein
MRTVKTTRSIVALGGALLALCLGACGSSASHAKEQWGDTVARVGRYTLTKPALEHWTSVEAVLDYEYKPSSPVPKGVIPEPPEYTSCIELKAKELPRGATVDRRGLKEQCALKRKSLQGHILEILVTNDWIHEEARAQGVKVSRAELNHMMHKEFADFKRFQQLTGEHEGDEQGIVESELLIGKLQKKAASKPGLSLEQQMKAAEAVSGEVIDRWVPRTSCAPGYVIYVCKEYKPHASKTQ